ncbi:hypothetical protein ScPMuIL_017790 [Solemya velum]
MKSLFRGFRKSTTDLSDWNKHDEKLMKAVKSNDFHKVQNLIHKKTINLGKLGPQGLSVFHIASELGNLRIVDFLLAEGNTSLQLASRNGAVDVVSKLVQSDAVLEFADSNGLTALHHACVCHQPTVVSCLLQMGCDVSVQDKGGKTPLYYVVDSGDLSVCRELLNRGANPNAADEHNHTLLMTAAKRGHREICDLLLKKGANSQTKDEKGNSALEYAISEGHVHLKEVFEKAPLRASWDLKLSETEPDASPDTVESPAPCSEMPEADQVDAVADYVVDRIVQVEALSDDQIELICTDQPSDNQAKSQYAAKKEIERQSLIDEKTLEEYKELEEEHEQMNEELHRLTLQNKKLQEVVDGLNSQLVEKEQQLCTLRDSPPCPGKKENELETQMIEEVTETDKMPSDQNLTQNNDDSWDDSDNELFDVTGRTMLKNGSDDGKMIAMLRSQILTLHQENDQLKKEIVKDPNSAELEKENSKLQEEIEELKTQVSVLSLALEKASGIRDEQLLESEKIKTDERKELPISSKDKMDNDSKGNSSEKAIEDDREKQSETLLRDAEMTAIQEENNHLRADCEHLNSELERLQSTYNKLVEAGDNLQDMYDQLLEEKEQLQVNCEEVSLERDKFETEKDSLQAQLRKLVHNQELSQKNDRKLQPEKDRMDKIVQALSLSEKSNKILETKEDLLKKCDDYEELIQQLRHDYAIVMEEIESLQDSCNQLELDRDQIGQEYETLQDEFEQLQQQHEVLQQDYEQLEQDYAQLLGDKDQIQHDLLAVQTTAVKVEQHNPILHEEKKQLLQANSALEYEKEQQDLTILELSNRNALLEEELSKLREQTHQMKQKKTEHNQANLENSHQIMSLQVQVSRLQQQLSESNIHFRDLINTYRTHLLSAIQGHLDPSIQQALFNIIELRGMEEDF